MSYNSVRSLLFSAVLLSLFLSAGVAAQSNVPPLLVQPIDESKLTTLKGNTHPLARAEFDQGAAPAGLPMKRMLLVLKRSPEQEQALRKLLDDQQDKSSANYHKWLTPEQFGQQFGLADSDVQTVTSWLQRHGFEVAPASKGRTVIEFSGTADLVRQAFHTEIHKYVVNGEAHWANASDPQIPAALTPGVAGVFTLHNFLKKPQIKLTEQKVKASYTPGPPAQLTFSNGVHGLTPGDYKVIYNANPVLQSGITGTGTAIAVVGRSNLFEAGSDVWQFRNIFGFCCYGGVYVILNGPDPGDLGGIEEAEATLDATWAGAVAPDARIDFVVSASTNNSDGVDLSELYIIDNNIAPIMTESFGICEAALGNAELTQISALAEQAAAQGITYMVSSGDSGAAGCDDPSNPPAQHAASVNALGSSPFTLTIGGTLFNEGSQPGAYWNTSNAPDGTSAKSYIPENAWNESSPTDGLWATGGGRSSFFAKPSWQSGVPGIPADGKRDVPDLSLTAALHDPYLLCLQGSCVPDPQGFIYLYFIGGTSASAPSFAGVMALVNQKTGSRQGQAGYVLYPLAAAQDYAQCNGSGGTPAASCVFIDTTVGNNSVPGLTGFNTTKGFDLATGLGSVNISNLVNKWNSVSFTPTTTTLTLSPQTDIPHGSEVQVSVTVTPNSGSGTPTGDVALLMNGVSRIDRFTLSGGVVASTTNLLPGGNYGVVARYAGDGTFGSSESGGVMVSVLPETSTTDFAIYSFDQSGNIIPFTSEPYGNPAYLRADIKANSGYGTPTGYLNFLDSSDFIPNNPYLLNSGGTAATAQGVWTLVPGSHSITASYNGDNSFSPNTSSPVDITVTKAATTLSVADAGDGQSETLTATVSTTSGGLAPSGSVTFFADGKQVGSPAPLSGGDGSGNLQSGAFTAATAIASLSATLGGAQTVTATYSGDGNYSAATPANPNFSLIPAGITITVPSPGKSGTVTINVRSLQGFSGTVSFGPGSCAGLPIKSSCSFNPASVTAHGSTTLTITTTAPTSAMLNSGHSSFLAWSMSSAGLIGMLLLGTPARRRRWSVLLSVLVIAFLAIAPGCGGGGGSGGGGGTPGTPTGTYTITVTGASGALVNSIKLTLNIQ